jgi:hypothetical protein
MSEIIVPQGNHQTIDFTALDEHGDPLSIIRMWFTVKRHSYDTDTNAVIKKNSHDSEGNPTPTEIEITDAAEGKADIKLLPADTASEEPLGYVYDVKVKTNANRIHSVVTREPFIIRPAITTREA